MNWYRKACRQGRVVKTAFAHPIGQIVRDDGQEGFIDYFGDIQRYAMDAYTISVFKTATDKKISVSITLMMNQVGTIMWQQFWKYDLKDEAKAKKTFGQVKGAAERVFSQFRKNEIPNVTMWCYLRDEVRDIDPENDGKSNIPHINWSRKVRYEKDWRSQIYGNRYPDIYGY